MRSRVILLLFLILVVSIFAIFGIKSLNSTTVTVKCNSKDKICTYQEAYKYGKVIEKKNFEFKDVMQCNVEQIYKKDISDRDIAIAHQIFIYLNYGNDKISFISNNNDKMVDICTNIFKRKSFKSKFNVIKIKG